MCVCVCRWYCFHTNNRASFPHTFLVQIGAFAWISDANTRKSRYLDRLIIWNPSILFRIVFTCYFLCVCFRPPRNIEYYSCLPSLTQTHRNNCVGKCFVVVDIQPKKIMPWKWNASKSKETLGRYGLSRLCAVFARDGGGERERARPTQYFSIGIGFARKSIVADVLFCCCFLLCFFPFVRSFAVCIVQCIYFCPFCTCCVCVCFVFAFSLYVAFFVFVLFYFGCRSKPILNFE